MVPGSNLQFDCQASGRPPPLYQWFINDTNVVNLTNRYTVFPNGTLFIRDITSSFNDGGNYSCLSSNIVGSVRVYFHVSIQLGFEGSSERIVLTRSTINLSCRYNNSQWKHNGMYYTVVTRKVTFDIII